MIVQILFSKVMLDNALNTIASTQSFYFQLYPLSLSIVNPNCEMPAKGTTYRFNILRGQQKMDETRLPIESSFREINGRNVMVMPKCPVNFYMTNVVKSRNVQFVYNMYQTENKQEYFIAQHYIDVEPYILEYKQSRNVRFQHTTKFSDDYELQYEIYVQKSRIALEKVVREYKNERTLKSPLRERPEGTTSPGSRRNLTKEETKKSESNSSVKEQREEVTELSSSVDQKIQSKRSSVKQSRRQEVNPVRTSRTQKEGEFERQAEKREEPQRSEAFVKKSRQPSEISSKKNTPEMMVKFKPVEKKDSEIKMSSSSRLPQNGSIIELGDKKQAVPISGGSDLKEKAAMTLFFLISLMLIYFCMQPSRKV